MDLQTLINSPALWLVSSIMVIVVVGQSIIFFREGFKQAKNLNIPRSQCIAGLRSAMITAIGPSLGPCIVMVALIAMLGAPTTWMRMNDIGAARTELAMATLAAKLAGAELNVNAFDVKTFSYVIWAMALNNLGWMAFSLLLVHRMRRVIDYMNVKWNISLTNMVMRGAIIGLFAFLISGPLLKGGGNIAAAIVAFVCMFIITKFFGKYKRFQELAIGLSMMAGMAAGLLI